MYQVEVKGEKATFNRFSEAVSYFYSLIPEYHKRVTWQLIRGLDCLIVGDIRFTYTKSVSK
jgi:hypothetical protein